ncbi:hypothetical protein [Streptomyces sp. GC420]|uniref:hypothetical protein n=1 Tax=Streptomyces sp. GC420 TaxID=2697568 RepID=UPI001415123D|nr:hypothetical protein [Streptomyces sp. GC420]NBM20685.1 hypothetical protein [Streptomyces sp. GC420]
MMRIRTACTGVVFGTALAIATSAMPAQAAAPARAAAGCETLRATVANSEGLSGGTVQATVCIYSDGGAALNTSYYNYVQDHQADGVAARAYIRDSVGWRGPLGVDDTSTSGGQELDRWESEVVGNTSVRVYVCLGKKYPGDSGARCASDVMYA